MTTTLSRIDPSNTASITLIEPIVTFDRDMIWADEYLWRSVIHTVTPTIDGGQNVQAYDLLEAGRPVTLRADGGFGMQTKAVVEALKAQADALGSKYYLEISHNGLTLQKVVIFRNEMEDGPVQFEPAKHMDGLQTAGVWYEGELFLAVDTWP